MERKDIDKIPDVSLVKCVEHILRYMETGDKALLSDTFSRYPVFLDSFAPYVFQGPNAADQWAMGLKRHAHNIKNLRHTLGEAQEYSGTDTSIFFSQPIEWEGEVNGQSFYETGGLALLFALEDGIWRVQHYGWAATSFVFK